MKLKGLKVLPFLFLAVDAHAAATGLNRNYQLLWPEGEIPYYFVNDGVSSEVAASMETTVNAATATWNSAGNQNQIFKFTRINASEKGDQDAYVEIRLTNPSIATECGAVVSPLGYPGKGQHSTFTLPSACPNAALHELGHVLGLVHEHQRKDANLVYNICNHRRVNDSPECPDTLSSDDRIFIYGLGGLGGWDDSTFPRNGYYITEQYDPFSVMHYSLRNNLKDELEDLVYPEAPPAGVIHTSIPVNGVYYTTIDFSRDPSVQNNLYDLAAHFGFSTPEGFYNGLRNWQTQLSPLDVQGIQELYAKDQADLHFTVAKTCFSHAGGDASCTRAGEFKQKLTVKNFGAWSANDVTITTEMNDAQIDFNSLVATSDQNANCLSDPSRDEYVCSIGTLTPGAEVVIDVTGLLINPDLKINMPSTLTSSSQQNKHLLDSSQKTTGLISVGGKPSCGCSCNTAATTAGTDPTLPAAALVSLIALYRRRGRTDITSH